MCQLLLFVRLLMAADPQTLNAEAACYVCFGASEVEADELALLARWAGGQGNIPAPVAADWTFIGVDDPPLDYYGQSHIVGAAPAGVTGYILQWSEDDFTWQINPATALAVNQTTDLGLTGITFYGQIAWAIGGVKVSDWSDTKVIDGPLRASDAGVERVTDNGTARITD